MQATGAVARVAPANSPEHPQPLGHDLDAMRRLVSPRTRLVYIANPNNPTGTWLETRELRSFVESLPRDVVVVLDEAYGEYISGIDFPDSLSWLATFPNLVITRTFSKVFGLAGLRVGYGISHPRIAELLNRVRQPFNVNSLGQVAALAALGDEAHLAASRSLNRQGIAQLADGLARLGIHFRVGRQLRAGRPRAARRRPLRAVAAGGRHRPARGELRLAESPRVTVGLPEHNQRFLAALEAALRQPESVRSEIFSRVAGLAGLRDDSGSRRQVDLASVGHVRRDRAGRTESAGSCWRGLPCDDAGWRPWARSGAP